MVSIAEAFELPKDHTQFCIVCHGSAPPNGDPHKGACPYKAKPTYVEIMNAIRDAVASGPVMLVAKPGTGRVSIAMDALTGLGFQPKYGTFAVMERLDAPTQPMVLDGMEDCGFTEFDLLRFLQASKHPIVLIVPDLDTTLPSVRGACSVVQG